jgi:HPt (histidine-containing phosphotransfer) domain-containing protein
VLETLPYDVVLMDVQMPEMDGLAATRKIRDPQSAVANHGIPIIAMTAHALQGDRETCLDAGMSDYVTKPVSPQALANALEKWLPPDIATRPVGRVKVPGMAIQGEHPGRTDLPVFDRKGMTSRLMDDAEIAKNVAACFLEDMPRQLQIMRDCLDSGDLRGIQRQAHSIKGASSNIGGLALCAVATEVEKVSALDTARDSVAELDLEFERLKQALLQDLRPSAGT